MTASDPPRPLPQRGERENSVRASVTDPPEEGAVARVREDERPKEDDRPKTDAREGKRRDSDDKAAAKRAKRAERLRQDAHRPLEAWERYRALTDTLDEAQELVDLADHKARFALIIMGGLNAVLFVLGTRTEAVDAIPANIRGWVAIYLIVYALVALYFFIQAIESLRPRKARPQISYPGEAGYEDYPMGLRFYEDILRRDVEAYRRAWREVHIGQLNGELAVQGHALARINHAKYGALHRLYIGLQIMTMMAAVLLTVDVYYMFVQHQGAMTLAPAAQKIKGGKPSRGGLNILGVAERITGSGAREPSGVAYHAGLGHMFVVGDEGSLVELDAEGRRVRSDAVKGNLEDLAVHTPSGNMVLLSEKKSEVIWYDPVQHQELRRWRLETAAVLGEEPADKNQGFEGIAFREVPGSPGGGVFYLVHQRAPAMIVAVTLDPSRPSGRLDGEIVAGRIPLKDREDLTAITYLPSLDRLLVITDVKDRLLVLRLDGTLEAEVVLPGLQQEGVSVDGSGRLWIADDRAGLFRFPGALEALKTALEAGATDSSTTDPQAGGDAR